MVKPTQSVDVVTSLQGLHELSGEWARLVDVGSPRNPFARPEWLLAWAGQFVPERDLRVVALRSDGQLVAVAPFYMHRIGRWLRCLRLLGSRLQDVTLTELPEIVCLPGGSRKSLRRIVDALHVMAADWDWVEIPLTQSQGWFEPAWLPGARDFVVHKTTRAGVVMPLATDWTAVLGGLKRNVRESVRRGYNRLERSNVEWRVITVGGNDPSLPEAMRELVRLHRLRAHTPDRVQHGDAFDDGGNEAFLLAVAPGMAAAGHLSVLLLEVAGINVCAQLVLEGPDSIYFSISGFDPAAWEYSPATVLKCEALKQAVARGAREAHLSMGPDTAKLRWSEQLEVHQEFALVGSSRRARAAFSLYWVASSMAGLARDRRSTGSRKRDAGASSGDAGENGNVTT